MTLGSIRIRREDLAAGPGAERLEDPEADLLLDEMDAAVGEQEIRAARVQRPVLVGVSQARGGIGAVPFAGVREGEGPAPLRIEARFPLDRHEGDGRAGDRTRPTGAREVLAPLAHGEGLAGAVGDLGDRDGAIAEEQSVAVVSAGGAVV